MSLYTTVTLSKEKTREVFDQFLQEELASLLPQEAVKKLYSEEPEQLSFNFEIPKD